MVERLVGPRATSAMDLARETGVSQEALSRWLRDARTVRPMPSDTRRDRSLTLEEKIAVLAAGAKLEGDALVEYLAGKGVALAEYESWRLALEDGGMPAKTANRRIRALEREVARKDKALAETAALLVLKKKVAAIYGEDEDDDMGEDNER